MRYTLLILIAAICFIGCKNNFNNNVITGKFYTQRGYDLLPCTCLYYYNAGFTFQDSCNKYNVLDTIK